MNIDKSLMKSIAVGERAYVQNGVIVTDGDVNPLIETCYLYCRDSADSGEVIAYEYGVNSIAGWRQINETKVSL